MVSLLADLRTRVNVKNFQVWTPLHVAIYQEQHDIVSLLLSDAGLNIVIEANPLDEAPLHIAAKTRNYWAVHLLTCDMYIADGDYTKAKHAIVVRTRVDTKK